MCLSRIYLREGNENSLLVEEAISVIDNDGVINIYSVFGENKTVKGCFIKEVNLSDNYTVLIRKKQEDE